MALLSWLQSGSGDQSLILFLRRLEYDYQSDSMWRFDDNQVTEAVRRALASGRIHICREQRATRSTGGAATTPPAKSEDEGPPTTPTRLKKTWVEFEVVDMEGNPAAGCKYLVMLPDGSLQEGTVGRSGVVRIENIDPENSVFSLSNLDREAWERV